jgi:hypothetical protein
MVCYCGIYSNAHRGKIRKAGAKPSHPPIIEDDPTYVPSKGWAEMIRKVYEIDPLLCPSGGGLMKVISFIEEPKTIDRIIRHLELTFEPDRPPPPSVVQQDLQMAGRSAYTVPIANLTMGFTSVCFRTDWSVSWPGFRRLSAGSRAGLSEQKEFYPHNRFIDLPVFDVFVVL